jgi:hypothetical protein
VAIPVRMFYAAILINRKIRFPVTWSGYVPYEPVVISFSLDYYLFR